MHPAYEAMVLETMNHPELLTSFQTDMTTHDKVQLNKLSHEEKFGWFLYEAGTWMIHSEQFMQSVHETMDHIPHRWYVWNGSNLVSCASVKEVSEKLFNAHR